MWVQSVEPISNFFLLNFIYCWLSSHFLYFSRLLRSLTKRLKSFLVIKCPWKTTVLMFWRGTIGWKNQKLNKFQMTDLTQHYSLICWCKWAMATRQDGNGWLHVGRLLQKQFTYREIWERIWTPKGFTINMSLTIKMKSILRVCRRDGFMSPNSKEKGTDNDKLIGGPSLGRKRKK